MPAQINHLRLRPLELFDLGVLADSLDAVAAHGNCLFAEDRAKLRIRRHAGVNIRVQIDNVGLGAGNLCAAGHRSLRPRGYGTQDCEGRETPHHSSTPTPAPPASASRISRIPFSPSSRPLESNHSCKVCAPPPDPPPPMAMASCPNDSGMFASVEARCTCAALLSCASTARITCRMRAPGCNSPAGRLPITTTSQLTPGARFCVSDADCDVDEDRICDSMVSSSIARFSASRRLCSSRSISAIDVERISTFRLADSGIEFTDVTPRITPMLKGVGGREAAAAT